MIARIRKPNNIRKGTQRPSQKNREKGRNGRFYGETVLIGCRIASLDGVQQHSFQQREQIDGTERAKAPPTGVFNWLPHEGVQNSPPQGSSADSQPDILDCFFHEIAESSSSGDYQSEKGENTTPKDSII